MAHVLFVRHHVEDQPGLIGRALVSLGHTLDVVLVDERAVVPSLAGADALVILGSSESVYDAGTRERWLDREFDLVVEADRRGLPILGICFGAQVLCQLAGGHVSRAAQSELGWMTVDPAPGSPIEPGPWFAYHDDACRLPAQAEVLATSPRAVQAFRVGRHLGVQFHPEVDAAQLRAWFAADSSAGRASARAAAFVEQALGHETSAFERATRLVHHFWEGAARDAGNALRRP